MDTRDSALSNAHKNVPVDGSNIIIRCDYAKSQSSVTSNTDATAYTSIRSKRQKRSLPHDDRSLASVPASMDCSSHSQQMPSSIETENIFDILSNVDPEEVNNAPSQVPASKTKKCRLPPISIVNIGTKQTRELLSSANIPQTSYHLKAVKSGTQLTVVEEQE